MWDILYLQAVQGLPPAHAAPHGPGKHQESQKHPSASSKAADWEENLKDVDVLHPSTSQAEQGMLNPGLFQSPTAKDAPRSSPKFRPPVSYPGSPCSWSSLGAIRSLASLKSTQRETQTVQICRCPPALQPWGDSAIGAGAGQGGAMHREGATRLETLPRKVSLGAGTPAGRPHPCFPCKEVAARGKAANSGADLGSLAAVQPCGADLTFFPLPGERGGMIQGKHSL